MWQVSDWGMQPLAIMIFFKEWVSLSLCLLYPQLGAGMRMQPFSQEEFCSRTIRIISIVPNL
jgi:hypothetical protein